jgi:allantoate deiminase
MKYRKDAAYAASKMIYDINKMAHEYGEPLVATVGKIELTPNTVNVVPGKAIFTIDVRHTEKEDILAFTEKMEKMMKETAEEFNVGINIDLWMEEDPVPMDQGIVQKIKEQCDKHDVNYKLMHSGAGHDTQRFAPLIPSAMVFVPSRDGISHNPAEYTEPKDLAEGIQVLINTLYELAYV